MRIFICSLADLVLAAALISSTPMRLSSFDPQANELLARMTLDEKIGQMTQVDMNGLKDKADIQKYFLGSMLSGGNSDPPDISAEGWAKAYDTYQAWALKTRLKIPLIFGMDVIHGYETVFPIPLGLSCSWDMAEVEKSARIAANSC